MEHYNDILGNFYKKYYLGIALYAILILIGLLELAIAIAASVCSCRVVCSGSDHSGSVHPGVVHSGSVYPGSVYPGSVYPGSVHSGAFVYQNSGSAYQLPGSVMQSPQMAAPQMAASQMAAPQMAAHEMAAPQMAEHEMAAPKLDEPQIQIQEVWMSNQNFDLLFFDSFYSFSECLILSSGFFYYLHELAHILQKIVPLLFSNN